MSIILKKLIAVNSDPIAYSFDGLPGFNLSNCLSQRITIKCTGNIFCIQCGRKTPKSYQQGFCFPCMRRLHECNMCVMHPERCRVMEGNCPKDDWAHVQCHAKQVIYLSYTSALKVGITQVANVPSRWVDQGAVEAIAVMTAENRFLCGQVEVALKAGLADKTNWRKMLQESPQAPDLSDAWEKVRAQFKTELDGLVSQYDGAITYIDNPSSVSLRYPILSHPEKVKSQSLEKTPEVSGILQGIKGQYLMLDTGVMNVRKFGGYEVTVEVDNVAIV